jgi:hypothetical protein
MKAEELFLAIGEVESSRLTRSELTTARPSGQREQEEPKMKKRNVSRILRNLLVAALIVSALAVTAYAVAGFVIFDSPQDMISGLFGDKTGYDHKDVTHFTDPEKPGEVYDIPAYDRVPVDESVAASEAVPLVSPVGQTISWEGYTLTVDANMYDQVTKCGVLTYTLENPDGIADYALQENGEIYFPDGEILDINQYGYSYIIPDQSTDTKLTAAFRLSDFQELWKQTKEQVKQEFSEDEVIEHLKQALGDEYEKMASGVSREEIVDTGYERLVYERLDGRFDCPEKITIPEKALGEMSNLTLADGNIKVSPIAICVDTREMQDYPEGYIKRVKISFKDGTEYVVVDENVANHMFAVGHTDRDVTFMFNRMIDVNEIASVILDGDVEFQVS